METSAIKPGPAESNTIPPDALPPIPPDHRNAAIVILILLTLSLGATCCACYGIPSFAGMAVAAMGLLQSAQVAQRYDEGNYAAALKTSNQVRNWLIAGILTPFVLILLFIAGSLLLFGGFVGIGTLVDYFKKQ